MKAHGDWKHLVGIFMLALVMRLAMVTWVQYHPSRLLPDEEQYLNLARRLAFVGDFQELPWDRLIQSFESGLVRHGYQGNPRDVYLEEGLTGAQRFIQRMPVYPLVIAGLMRIFGDTPLLVIRLFQAALGAFSCLLVYLLACEFFDGRGRLWAGWLAAVYPFWIFFTALALTETLFIFLLLLTWLLVARMVRRPNFSDMLIGGLLAGLTVLTRGSALGLFLLLIPLGWLPAPARRLRVLAACVGLVVVMLITLGPWVARNYVLTRSQSAAPGVRPRGRIILTTCAVGRSLYEAVGPEADGGPAMDRIAVPGELMFLTEWDVDRWYFNRALESIRKQPGRFLKLTVVKFLRTWNPLPNFSEYRRPFYYVVSAGSFLPVMFLAVWGWLCVRRPARGWLLLILPVFYFTLTHMVFIGSVRYRLPMMGFVLALSGVGLSALLARRRPDVVPAPESEP